MTSLRRDHRHVHVTTPLVIVRPAAASTFLRRLLVRCSRAERRVALGPMRPEFEIATHALTRRVRVLDPATRRPLPWLHREFRPMRDARLYRESIKYQHTI